MTGDTPLLGIDIGSVSACLVLLSGKGKVFRADYRFHRGKIRETLARMLGDLGRDGPVWASCTSSTPGILRNVRRRDSTVCVIDAARRFHGKLGALLVVGGEKFSLLRFDEQGRFAGLKSSTSCAAGTGSFLDQQAARLGLSGSAELAELALANRGEPPTIASRCSVFAKTDLCHAQQAGYSLEEICDGLCLGLARTIFDTISNGGELPSRVCFAGGVSRNGAVKSHLERVFKRPLETGHLSHLYGAYGACLGLLEDLGREEAGGGASSFPEKCEALSPASCADMILPPTETKTYFYEPLSLKLSRYPDFESVERRRHVPSAGGSALPVEVDLYDPLPAGAVLEAVLGVDVGSTSTKAVLMDLGKGVRAGFYTRTAGRPLAAVRAILEALDRLCLERGTRLAVLAAGTTGAGRRFVGRVIGADLVMNEITAHARAAWELNPATDTIIEIGGQDSKFTTLRDGRVTFAQMNTVCAAGTGSFLEEQAAKLGVPLEEYSRRAEEVRAPIASDRCTVFMERDINHYLSNKYSVDEILAAALYSVSENYLLKVASEALIGDAVCFQGATAKNRALVAAFEQKLGKPIFVSRYCHLAGALGVALTLLEALPSRSSFRGLGLHREEIPVRAEACELCRNRCRIRIAEVQGEEVAFGFACGREYGDKRFVSRNKSGFDLLGAHARAFAFDEGEGGPAEPVGAENGPLVGIPAALHLYAELPLWKSFFSELGIRTITSEACGDGLKRGKELAGAEFCAPVAELHGHALYLAERCDYVFLPFFLDAPRGEGSTRRHRSYCYYTQFAPSIVSLLKEGGLDKKCLMPLVDHGTLGSVSPAGKRTAPSRTKRELFDALKGAAASQLTLGQVSRAYDRALRRFRRGLEELGGIAGGRADGLRDRGGDIDVVLTGRPYLILSRAMNKGIPEIFGSLGIRTLYQDMIGARDGGGAAPGGPGNCDAAAGEALGVALGEALGEIGPLLDVVHWQHAARILETAAACTRIDGLYPVLVTAFKCAPDSFVIEYFKRILDAYGKPYLILQLDEHDSNVGYETRIEAGVHSFRNHFRRLNEKAALGDADPPPPAPVRSFIPRVERSLEGKILLFPNWDTVTSPLVVANLQGAGIDARLLEEDQLTIQKSMRLNTGQCIPVNIIAQETVDYIRARDLDPSKVVLWMAKAEWSCGIHIYPYFIKSLLEGYGGGMERAGVYVGDVSHGEISRLLPVHTYFAYLFGGLIRRLGCRIRPYEVREGETDEIVAVAGEIFARAFRERGSKLEALGLTMERFEAIPRRDGPRPKAAIFGDIYVRDNDVMNQDLVRCIEKAGGEVVTTPYSEYVRIIADAHFKRLVKERRYIELAKYKALLGAIGTAERRFVPRCRSFVSPPRAFRNPHAEEDLRRFHLRLEHSGESHDNVLKILHLLKVHPDIRLFVQTNPAFCCPSLVTEAMARKIEELTGVPVVTLTYDGTGSPKNDLIAPYLKYLRSNP